DLSRHAVFAPTSVAPDIAVGVNDRIGVAVLTSRASELGLGAGAGVCIQGAHETLGMAPPKCDQPLADVEAAVQARITSTFFASVGILMHTPSTYGSELVVGTQRRAGPWWTVVAPAVVIGITGRDENRDRARLAVYGGRDLGVGEVHL